MQADRRAGTARIRREELSVGRHRFALVSFQGGAWELYRIEPSGLEMFVGYAPDALCTVVAALRASSVRGAAACVHAGSVRS